MYYLILPRMWFTGQWKFSEKTSCDSLLAVGGGSPMDTAKAVNIVLSEKSDDLMKFEGADRLKSPMKPSNCCSHYGRNRI
jgi:alcohol dehydrogenase class IV